MPPSRPMTPASQKPLRRPALRRPTSGNGSPTSVPLPRPAMPAASANVGPVSSLRRVSTMRSESGARRSTNCVPASLAPTKCGVASARWSASPNFPRRRPKTPGSKATVRLAARWWVLPAPRRRPPVSGLHRRATKRRRGGRPVRPAAPSLARAHPTGRSVLRRVHTSRRQCGASGKIKTAPHSKPGSGKRPSIAKSPRRPLFGAWRQNRPRPRCRRRAERPRRSRDSVGKGSSGPALGAPGVARSQPNGSTRTSVSERLSPDPQARWRAFPTSISVASRGGKAWTMAPSSRGVK